MTFILRLAKVGLRFLYLFLRPLPLKNKIVFFSRQSSTIPLDFTLLAKEIQKQSPETEIVYFCRKMRRKTKVFSYCCFILHSLYHLATASIAVTDTYSIQLCVLHPKRGQTVVQVWHAVGAVKQFSYQCLDKPGGQPTALAKAMEMHKNYDYVFCTSEATADIYAQGSGCPGSRFCRWVCPVWTICGRLIRLCGHVIWKPGRSWQGSRSVSICPPSERGWKWGWSG